MKEATLKAFIVAEVRKQTVEMFEPMLNKCQQLLEQVREREQEMSALHKEFKDLLEEEKRYRPAMILKLAAIERSLGIDPDGAELDPNYRN